MRFTFVSPISPSVVNHQLLQNAGYDRGEVLSALARLEGQGHTVELLDGTSLSDEQRQKLFSDVWTFSLYKEVRVVHTYGSRKSRRRWNDFGRGVPALLVYKDADLVGVYPHVVGSGFLTMAAFLASLL